MKKNYKKLAVVIAVMILTLSIASTGFAANLKKSMAVTYRNIKVISNGVQAYFANEPFIVDEQGRTYLALNDMASLFNKDIFWDNATSTITINDKPGQNIQELYNQVLTQQQTISQLESKIKTLEAELEEDDDLTDLDELAEELLDDHDEIEGYIDGYDVTFDVEEIVLKGDEDEIEVRIYLDLSSSEWDDWEDFEYDDYFEDDIIDYLQGIVDDILDERDYEDAEIDGFIEDEDEGKLVRFTVDKYGDVELD